MKFAGDDSVGRPEIEAFFRQDAAIKHFDFA
jgi:hypothetical protein